MNSTQPTATSVLVDSDGLLGALFGEKSNWPCKRWLQYQVAKKTIPAFKISGLMRFDVAMVRAALEKNCLTTASVK